MVGQHLIRGPAPQRQRVVGDTDHVGELPAREKLSDVIGHRLESCRVDLIAQSEKPVPGAVVDQHLRGFAPHAARFQNPAQPPDLGVQSGLELARPAEFGKRSRVRPPPHGQQLVDRHPLIGPQRKHCQDCRGPRPTDRHLTPVHLDHQRAQITQPHERTLRQPHAIRVTCTTRTAPTLTDLPRTASGCQVAVVRSFISR